VRGEQRLPREQRLADLIAEGEFGAGAALGERSLVIIREQFHRFADGYLEDVYRWHREDRLIPIEVIEELAGLGIFGLTVPEEHGGLGLGKLAMCVVTEELSRGYIGLGSLGTRSEIAAELIRLGGTETQKKKWLPGLATGACDGGLLQAGTRPISAACAHGPSAMATHIASPATRPGSPMPRAAM
jgi:(2S)-methylsuccinyl-CoA dehydrogenase